MRINFVSTFQMWYSISIISFMMQQQGFNRFTIVSTICIRQGYLEKTNISPSRRWIIHYLKTLIKEQQHVFTRITWTFYNTSVEASHKTWISQSMCAVFKFTLKCWCCWVKVFFYDIWCFPALFQIPTCFFFVFTNIMKRKTLKK